MVDFKDYDKQNEKGNVENVNVKKEKTY